MKRLVSCLTSLCLKSVKLVGQIQPSFYLTLLISLAVLTITGLTVATAQTTLLTM